MGDASQANNILEIGEQLGLCQDKQHKLVAIVTRIRETIQAHRAAEASLASRDELNKVLRGISRSLNRLEKNFGLLAGRDGGLLSGIYSTMLAHQLSNKGLEASLDRKISLPEPSFRILESRDAQSRDGPYAALEREHYQPVRAMYARAHTPDLLQGLFRQLHERLDAYQNLNRKHSRGGSKGRPVRNHALEILAKEFSSLFGRRPTSSPNGPFCILCEHVLTELGESTDGLETAIRRVLKKTKA